MQASELITQLQGMVEKVGDLEVVTDEGYKVTDVSSDHDDELEWIQIDTEA
jgi:hypothetical protein